MFWNSCSLWYQQLTIAKLQPTVTYKPILPIIALRNLNSYCCHGQETQAFWRAFEIWFYLHRWKKKQWSRSVLCATFVLCADAGFVKPSKFTHQLQPNPSNMSKIIYSSFKPVVGLDSLPTLYCCEVVANDSSGRSVLQWHKACQCVAARRWHHM